MLTLLFISSYAWPSPTTGIAGAEKPNQLEVGASGHLFEGYTYLNAVGGSASYLRQVDPRLDLGLTVGLYAMSDELLGLSGAIFARWRVVEKDRLVFGFRPTIDLLYGVGKNPTWQEWFATYGGWPVFGGGYHLQLRVDPSLDVRFERVVLSFALPLGVSVLQSPYYWVERPQDTKFPGFANPGFIVGAKVGVTVSFTPGVSAYASFDVSSALGGSRGYALPRLGGSLGLVFGF